MQGYAVSAPVGSGDTNIRSSTGEPSGQVRSQDCVNQVQNITFTSQQLPCSQMDWTYAWCQKGQSFLARIRLRFHSKLSIFTLSWTSQQAAPTLIVPSLFMKIWNELCALPAGEWGTHAVCTRRQGHKGPHRSYSFQNYV